MSVTAGLSEITHFIVKRLPVTGQDMLPGDNNINLACPICHRRLDFPQLGIMRRKTRRKTGRDSRHRDEGSIKGGNSFGDETMIDADRTSGYPAVGNAQRFQQILTHRMSGLGAKPPHSCGRVITTEGCQVDAGNCFEQPSGLRILLDGPPPAKRCAAALDC